MPGAGAGRSAIDAQRRANRAVNPGYANAAEQARAERQLRNDLALQERTLHDELRKLTGRGRQPEVRRCKRHGLMQSMHKVACPPNACAVYTTVVRAC
eukprot:364262-Chlamydomonas_euryale.AAC.8